METAKSLYKEMYDLTAPECAKCRVPHSCCDSMYCEFSREWAKNKFGVTLKETGHPRLPFMGESGCTVEPHLRPLCTLHVCDIAGLGYKRNDPNGEWTKKYWKLRNKIEEVEYEGDNHESRNA